MSLAKLADYLVAEGVVTDISHEGLRALLREEGVSFEAVRSWKRSNDPAFESKKNRIFKLFYVDRAPFSTSDPTGSCNRRYRRVETPASIRSSTTAVSGSRETKC